MEIVHNIALNVSEKTQNDFKIAGIELSYGFTSFKINEGDEKWKQVSTLMKKYSVIDTITSKFTKKELAGARNLVMLPTWHHGYPEPSEDSSYKCKTYDLSAYCPHCGCGAIQNASFRFLKEPKWGKKNILQINWVYDEYFVLPKIWESVFKPFGISCRKVLHDKTDKELQTVVQLIIPRKDISLELSGYPTEVCNGCKRVKYLPISRGFFPPLNGKCDSPIFKSNDVFGSGAKVFNAVIVSHALWEVIERHKMKGVTFYPIE